MMLVQHTENAMHMEMLFVLKLGFQRQFAIFHTLLSCFYISSKGPKCKRYRFTFEIQNEQNVLVQQQQKQNMWVILQFHCIPIKYIIHSEIINAAQDVISYL